MKPTTIAIIVAAAVIGGTLLFTKSNSQAGVTVSANNVSVVNGQQIIEINAKGGYLPRRSVAKAGVPTILRVKTDGTFDCSSSLRIPSLNLSKILPPSGSIDIDLGLPTAAILQGFCGMGMYSFAIDFES